MNTTEELDDFELSIRSKLADFEVTPPEGSWNAIVHNVGTEGRKMRMVWFNKSSFFMIFFASMFSMWLAFGSISFDLNKYEKESLILLNDIKESRSLVIENNTDNINETFLQEKAEINNMKLSFESDLDISNESILPIKKTSELYSNEELHLVNYIDVENVSSVTTEQLTIIQTLFQTDRNIINPIRLNNRFSLYGNVEQGLLYSGKLLNEVKNSSLSKGKIFQHQNLIGIDVAYSLNKNIEIATGIKYQRIVQQNNYIEAEHNITTRTDSILLGYIQHPVTGKMPVYEYKTYTENNFIDHNRSFNNILQGIEIPLSVSWKFLRKNNFSLALNLNGTYSTLKANEYRYLDEEGLVVINNAQTINLISSTTSLVADYRFSSMFSFYVKPLYSKSNIQYFNNGAGIALGLKYKFY